MPVLDLQEAEKILASKEAARRAAAEEVAAALAQVEEMRQSVMAANQQMASQLGSNSSSSIRGGNGTAYTKIQVSYKPMTSPNDADAYSAEQQQHCWQQQQQHSWYLKGWRADSGLCCCCGPAAAWEAKIFAVPAVVNPQLHL